jgi:hypothetical protein
MRYGGGHCKVPFIKSGEGLENADVGVFICARHLKPRAMAGRTGCRGTVVIASLGEGVSREGARRESYP